MDGREKPRESPVRTLAVTKVTNDKKSVKMITVRMQRKRLRRKMFRRLNPQDLVTDWM